MIPFWQFQMPDMWTTQVTKTDPKASGEVYYLHKPSADSKNGVNMGSMFARPRLRE
jgi:hypothetical protein